MTERSRVGRPKAVTLLPEHAELMRDAVRKTCRYFGIRVRDLSKPSKWINDAMRAGPMALSTAERLYTLIQRPNPVLVAKKRPQGESLHDTWMILEREIDKPQNERQMQLTPATEYIGSVLLAGLHLMRYTNPTPGTALFVLPGAADAVARDIVASMPVPRMTSGTRRGLVEFFRAYLSAGEEPFTDPSVKEITPRLVYNALARNLRILADYQRLIPDDEDPLQIINTLETIVAAERTRGEEQPQKRGTRKKRKVVMPEVRSVINR